jgi:hypothetical protein
LAALVVLVAAAYLALVEAAKDQLGASADLHRRVPRPPAGPGRRIHRRAACFTVRPLR